MPPSAIAAATAKLTKHIHEKYLGSGDIELQDGISFCSYFDLHYGTNTGKAILKDKLQRIENTMRNGLGWTLREPIGMVMPSDPDDEPEFYVAPWQLGLSAAHGVKGESKLVHVVDIVDGFLKKPYTSKQEPL